VTVTMHRLYAGMDLRLLALICLLLSSASAGETRPLMRDVMGINGHFTFKPQLYRPLCRLVRNYHNIDWDVRRPGDPITVPRCVNKVDWVANAYGPWNAAGFETDICLQFNEFAKDGYQALWAGQEDWCTAYGKAVAACFAANNGRRLATSYEIGNEPGARFDAELYRRVFTAMATGIRAGDPRALIVTATAHAADANDYAQDLRAIYGDKAMLPLFDVINIHTYAEVPRTGKGSPWTRSYPEDPAIDYLRTVDEAIAWRNKTAKGKQIWVTEFGYDACTPEAMPRRTGWAKKLDWQGVDDLQQAQYIVRSYLALAERDVARAYLYFYDDKDEPGIHACAGVTRNFQPKPSYHAVAQLQALLGDCRFSRVVRQDPGKLRVQEYIGGPEARGKVVWVAWSPTGCRTDAKTGYVPAHQRITLTGLPGRATVAVMAIAADPARAPEAKNAGTSITVEVGESPIYLVMHR
jgi:hypothetical protein